MDPGRERIYRLLLTYPQSSWMQKDLASRARCSRGYVSRLVGELVEAGVLARPYKNRVVLTGPSKLFMLWAARRRLPTPTFVVTRQPPEEVESVLAVTPGTALTLFRAAWHRTKFMAVTAVEAYVPEGDLRSVAERLGDPTTEPTSVVLYPTEGGELEGAERAEGVPLVSVPQNVVDLIAFGGQGPRVAMHLARAGGLLEA